MYVCNMQELLGANYCQAFRAKTPILSRPPLKIYSTVDLHTKEPSIAGHFAPKKNPHSRPLSLPTFNTIVELKEKEQK